MGFTKLLFGSRCPLWLRGRQKDSEQVFPAGFVPHSCHITKGSLLLILLFLLFDPVPPACASLFMKYVEKKLPLLSLSPPNLHPHLHYLSPTSSCAPPHPPPPIYPPSYSPSPTLPGPSPGFHPSRPATTGVYVSVREFVWDQSFPPPSTSAPLRGLTASQHGQWRHCQQPGHEKCIA